MSLIRCSLQIFPIPHIFPAFLSEISKIETFRYFYISFDIYFILKNSYITNAYLWYNSKNSIYMQNAHELKSLRIIFSTRWDQENLKKRVRWTAEIVPNYFHYRTFWWPKTSLHKKKSSLKNVWLLRFFSKNINWNGWTTS